MPFTGSPSCPFRNPSNRFKLKLDGVWNDVPLATSSILQIYFPLLNVNISQELDDDAVQLLAIVHPYIPIIAKLLALSVDHIDLLLEDWYPSLGTRFVHTSEGRFLITRLVLCPKCLRKITFNRQTASSTSNNDISVGAASSIRNTTGIGRQIHVINTDCDLEHQSGLNFFSAYLSSSNVQQERRSEVINAITFKENVC